VSGREGGSNLIEKILASVNRKTAENKTKGHLTLQL
jgi:hypothetical protein